MKQVDKLIPKNVIQIKTTRNRQKVKKDKVRQTAEKRKKGNFKNKVKKIYKSMYEYMEDNENTKIERVWKIYIHTKKWKQLKLEIANRSMYIKKE